MNIAQFRFTHKHGWQPALPSVASTSGKPQLLLCFGSQELLFKHGLAAQLKSSYPQAQLLGCSTAGEIIGTKVGDDSLSVSLLEFNKATFRIASRTIQDSRESATVGTQLAKELSQEGLRHVLVFSDGLLVNGTALSDAITQGLPAGVALTGGLAADGSRFDNTQVCLNHSEPQHQVVAIGLYGDNIQIGYGSLGGWDAFGPKRTITRSEGNVLYELDGRSALELYKSYLGEHAADLPASALLFPLQLNTSDKPKGVVRTILSVDEEEQSMTFAGDLPEDETVTLMYANFDHLIDGASLAAEAAQLDDGEAEFALLISCVGRKLVLQQRIEEEVEGVREVLGQRTALAGFYSYGEICPLQEVASLHNQTMTITTLKEI